MVKAEINLPNGTKINIEGTTDDIMKIQEAFSNSQSKENIEKKSRLKKRNFTKTSSKEGPLGRIRELIKDDFFKEKRVIEEVKKILEEKAIFYRTNDLSPSLIRLVKKGELRRLKEEGQWRYVNP